MRKATTLLILSPLFLLVAACITTNPQVSNGVAVLSDEPPIEFSTSGWQHTDTTNPFLLTPDSLTNAMIGVSRLRSGDFYRGNDGPRVPDALDTSSIRSLLREKLRDRTDLKLSTRSLRDQEVAKALYSDGDKLGLEYAFELEGYLISVLLRAKPGAYFDGGTKAANRIVETMRPL